MRKRIKKEGEEKRRYSLYNQSLCKSKLLLLTSKIGVNMYVLDIDNKKMKMELPKQLRKNI